MPKIFLSPSTQEWNQYVNGGNEQLYMNMLADKMEPYLEYSGIQFVRNDPDRNVNGAIKDSNSGNYDAHIALHTNAGGGNFAGRLKGVDIYYSPVSNDSRELATIIANNMKEVYPIPDKVRAVPTTSLGEVTRTRAVAILAEIGYHDNAEDEAWIKSNLGDIAKNIVESLCDYFGIPFIENGNIRRGMISAGGSNLNIRAYPSMNGRIIGSAPDKSNVTIYSQYGDWYVINYQNTVGYVNKNFVISE